MRGVYASVMYTDSGEMVKICLSGYNKVITALTYTEFLGLTMCHSRHGIALRSPSSNPKERGCRCRLGKARVVRSTALQRTDHHTLVICQPERLGTSALCSLPTSHQYTGYGMQYESATCMYSVSDENISRILQARTTARVGSKDTVR